MMKIKSYRAASLREALLQIKQELGEDALVLETKQVRAGGFFGVGGRNLIEVCVASSSKNEMGNRLREQLIGASRAATGGTKASGTGNARARTAKTQSGGTQRIHLRDDSSATPATPAAPAATATPATPATPAPPSALTEAEVASSPTFAALAARTYANNKPRPAAGNLDSVSPAAPSARATMTAPRAPLASGVSSARSESIELAETAPRIVHRQSIQRSGQRSNQISNQMPGQSAAAAGTVDRESAAGANHHAGSQRHGGNSELARLRAELREVKFSIEAFASRSVAREEMKTLAAAATDPAIYDPPRHEIYLELTAAGLPPALAHQAVQTLNLPETDETYSPKTAAREILIEALPSWIQFAEAPLAVNTVAAFIGPTGVGKTTTIAKLAARIALRARRRVEMITLDTYRIAAVEQLKTYAEIIGAGCHVARSVVELDALTQRFTGEATVLIDTTGRSPHDLADQLDLADYLRRNEALLKCLVLSATTHPADAQLAINKFSLYGANRLVLTKLDETVQAGAAAGVAADAELPLIYLSAGQRVPEDLERATAVTFANHVMRATGDAATSGNWDAATRRRGDAAM